MLPFVVDYRNKDSAILRPKIDTRNKRPLIALKNIISAPGANWSIYGTSPLTDRFAKITTTAVLGPVYKERGLPFC